MAKTLHFHKGNPVIKKSHVGLLHEDTDTPMGDKIPQSKIKAAEHSKDPAIRKRAFFADTAEHKWNK